MSDRNRDVRLRWERRYREINGPTKAEYMQEYWEQHKAEMNAAKRACYARNKERFAEAQRLRRAGHRRRTTPCDRCGKPIPYAGRGRPLAIHDTCIGGPNT